MILNVRAMSLISVAQVVLIVETGLGFAHPSMQLQYLERFPWLLYIHIRLGSCNNALRILLTHNTVTDHVVQRIWWEVTMCCNAFQVGNVCCDTF